MNYIALAVPGFFLLIGVELAVSRLRRRELYRFNDAVTDLGCGISSEVTKFFLQGLLFAGYVWLHARFALFELSASSAAVWIATFIAVDFAYYWWHRMSHEVAFLWAAHVVHHQSEDYNLAVALRQALFTGLTSWAFYAPLALMGVPPLVIATCQAFNTLYQFWIHTELIGKLGPVEWVMNTPSAHRIHHAINPRYLDKNYAGVFIVWDRLFGTYTPEETPPVYGITKPLESLDPIWANFHVWVEILRKARAARSLGDKLRAFLREPAWQPPELGPPIKAPEVERESFQKFAPAPLSAASTAWVALNFLGVATALVSIMLFKAQLGWALVSAASLVILLTLWNWGNLFEHRRWAWTVEGLRVAALAAVLAAWQLGMIV